MNEEDIVSTLVRLGFSPNQAKVYIALVRLGKCASAKNVWEISGVAREQVYRKLRELAKIGVIECVLSDPALFRACPLNCVIDTMIRNKIIAVSDLQTETEILLQNFVENEKAEKPQAAGIAFSLVPKGLVLLHKMGEELENVTSSLDTVCSWTKGTDWILWHCSLFEKALERNVKIRFIIQKTADDMFPSLVKKLENSPLFNIKPIATLPPACMVLFDQKILLIDTSTTTQFAGSPALWSKNPCLAAMAQVYFERLWTNSLEIGV